VVSLLSACTPQAPFGSSDTGRDTFTEAEREGVLTTSKGNPALEDVLLAHEPIIRRFGKDWARTAVGTRVRVKGLLRVHTCGQHEQCLLSGQIPVLTPDNIEVLAEPAPRARDAAAPVPSVPASAEASP
jgi:hypothetical protein